MAEYVLARGDAGRRRLEILNEAMWPSSLRLLRRAGMKRGMSLLDVGCGGGEVTGRIAAVGVQATGVDIDPGFIEAASVKFPAASFACLPVSDLPSFGRRFDVVYSRYLLAHLDDPAAAIRAMMSVARPGGLIVLEDVDFGLHVAEPWIPAFDRYLDMYTEVVRRRGGDPNLGRRLFSLATDAGLRRVRASAQVSIFTQGAPKRMSSLTLQGSRDALLAAGLTTEAEIESLLADFKAFEEDPRSLVSIAGTHQVWGRVPS